MRALGVVTIFAGIDEEKVWAMCFIREHVFSFLTIQQGPQLFKVDPAGHVLGFKVPNRIKLRGLCLDTWKLGFFQACASGSKEQEANNFLEKRVKSNAAMSFKEAMETV